MRKMNTEQLIPEIRELAMKACYELDDNVVNAFRDALQQEKSEYSRQTLELLIENAEYAKKEQIPCCHDTGVCVVLLEIGQEIAWEGMPLFDAVNEGVRQGYRDGYLRKSVVKDPLERVNTGDNTPAVLHTEIVPGDKVTITVMPKGGGSENMGAFTTLVPGEAVCDGNHQACGGKDLPAHHRRRRRGRNHGLLYMDRQKGSSSPYRPASSQASLRETGGGTFSGNQ